MPAASQFRLSRAASWLKAGGVVAYPTEAVYGLGCDPLDEQAVDHVLALKGRPAGKGLIVIGADYPSISWLMAPLTGEQRQRLEQSWPGPVTWIVPASDAVPNWLTGGGSTVAVRVTAHPLAAALCRAFGGALVSTSANPSDAPPAKTAVKVRDYFGDAVRLLAGPLGNNPKPTAIYEL